MNIQYFNVFLCRNGEKTNYDLSKLIDKIRVSSPVERTVKLGSQHTMAILILMLMQIMEIKNCMIDGWEIIIFIKGKLSLLLKHQWEMLHRFLMMIYIF